MRLSPFGLFLLAAAAQEPTPLDFSRLSARAVGDDRAPVTPQGIIRNPTTAEIQASARTFLGTEDEFAHARMEATFRIAEPAQHHSFFGEAWMVWPGADDALWMDHGFEALLGLRESAAGGYRIQVSHRRQGVALVKYPHGGYLRVAAAEIKKDADQRLSVSAVGDLITVALDGRELIRYRDRERPLLKGRGSVGSGSQAKVVFRDFRIHRLPEPPSAPDPAPAHVPAFALRTWLGDRPWLMDGDEPIMMLPTPAFPCFHNVKLRPGWKPLLLWNSGWELDNQGGDKDLASTYAFVEAVGGGSKITLKWKNRHVKNRFEIQSAMTVGFDPVRKVYTYDVESELEVLPGEPFRFRNAIDFEHHTPLDPFRWKHQVVRLKGGRTVKRPLRPEDPGTIQGVAFDGFRLLYGRQTDDLLICPQVQYQVTPERHLTRDPSDRTVERELSTAVCAAFYDTGIAFPAETLPAGTKLPVRYRYTALPAEEARRQFDGATVHELPTLDPTHRYVFTGNQWPKIRFGQVVPLDAPWWGGHPFLSGHNRRPVCSADRVAGVGDVLRFGPGSYAAAFVNAPLPLQKAYVVRVRFKLENVHGSGARMEVLATDQVNPNNFVRHASAVLREERCHLGSGSVDWQSVSFAVHPAPSAKGLAIGFGNPGTGSVLVSEVEFEPVREGAALPSGVLPEPRKSPAVPDVPGLLADYRMEEQSGLAVCNQSRRERFFYDGSSQEETGLLHLANLDWVVDQGRPALRFADRDGKAPAFDPATAVARAYFLTPGYAKARHVPAAIAGFHGGGQDMKALSISTWVKPDGAMKPPSPRGDIVGVGARRLILSLYGDRAPYRLGARLDVNDELLDTSTPIEAGRWTHVGVTCVLEGEAWTMSLFADGREIARRRSERLREPLNVKPSIVLGAELFYLHGAYYRGLIGRTMVYDRVLSAEEMKGLASQR